MEGPKSGKRQKITARKSIENQSWTQASVRNFHSNSVQLKKGKNSLAVCDKLSASGVPSLRGGNRDGIFDIFSTKLPGSKNLSLVSSNSNSNCNKGGVNTLKRNISNNDVTFLSEKINPSLKQPIPPISSTNAKQSIKKPRAKPIHSVRSTYNSTVKISPYYKPTENKGIKIEPIKPPNNTNFVRKSSSKGFRSSIKKSSKCFNVVRASSSKSARKTFTYPLNTPDQQFSERENSEPDFEPHQSRPNDGSSEGSSIFPSKCSFSCDKPVILNDSLKSVTDSDKIDSMDNLSFSFPKSSPNKILESAHIDASKNMQSNISPLKVDNVQKTTEVETSKNDHFKSRNIFEMLSTSFGDEDYTHSSVHRLDSMDEDERASSTASSNIKTLSSTTLGNNKQTLTTITSGIFEEKALSSSSFGGSNKSSLNFFRNNEQAFSGTFEKLSENHEKPTLSLEHGKQKLSSNSFSIFKKPLSPISSIGCHEKALSSSNNEKALSTTTHGNTKNALSTTTLGNNEKALSSTSIGSMERTLSTSSLGNHKKALFKPSLEYNKKAVLCTPPIGHNEKVISSTTLINHDKAPSIHSLCADESVEFSDTSSSHSSEISSNFTLNINKNEPDIDEIDEITFVSFTSLEYLQQYLQDASNEPQKTFLSENEDHFATLNEEVRNDPNEFGEENFMSIDEIPIHSRSENHNDITVSEDFPPITLEREDLPSTNIMASEENSTKLLNWSNFEEQEQLLKKDLRKCRNHTIVCPEMDGVLFDLRHVVSVNIKILMNSLPVWMGFEMTRTSHIRKLREWNNYNFPPFPVKSELKNVSSSLNGNQDVIEIPTLNKKQQDQLSQNHNCRQEESQPEIQNKMQSQPEELGKTQHQPEALGKTQNQPEALGKTQSQPEALGKKQIQPEIQNNKMQNQPEALGKTQSQPEALGKKQSQPEALGKEQIQPEALGKKQSQPKTQSNLLASKKPMPMQSNSSTVKPITKFNNLDKMRPSTHKRKKVRLLSLSLLRPSSKVKAFQVPPTSKREPLGSKTKGFQLASRPIKIGAHVRNTLKTLMGEQKEQSSYNPKAENSQLLNLLTGKSNGTISEKLGRVEKKPISSNSEVCVITEASTDSSQAKASRENYNSSEKILISGATGTSAAEIETTRIKDDAGQRNNYHGLFKPFEKLVSNKESAFLSDDLDTYLEKNSVLHNQEKESTPLSRSRDFFDRCVENAVRGKMASRNKKAHSEIITYKQTARKSISYPRKSISNPQKIPAIKEPRVLNPLALDSSKTDGKSQCKSSLTDLPKKFRIINNRLNKQPHFKRKKPSTLGKPTAPNEQSVQDGIATEDVSKTSTPLPAKVKICVGLSNANADSDQDIPIPGGSDKQPDYDISFFADNNDLDRNLSIQHGGIPPCTKPFCHLGCVCDSISNPFNSEINRNHCGKVNCMFGCKCVDFIQSIGYRSSRIKKRPSFYLDDAVILYDGYGLLSREQKKVLSEWKKPWTNPKSFQNIPQPKSDDSTGKQLSSKKKPVSTFLATNKSLNQENRGSCARACIYAPKRGRKKVSRQKDQGEIQDYKPPTKQTCVEKSTSVVDSELKKLLDSASTFDTISHLVTSDREPIKKRMLLPKNARSPPKRSLKASSQLDFSKDAFLHHCNLKSTSPRNFDPTSSQKVLETSPTAPSHETPNTTFSHNLNNDHAPKNIHLLNQKFLLNPSQEGSQPITTLQHSTLSAVNTPSQQFSQSILSKVNPISQEFSQAVPPPIVNIKSQANLPLLNTVSQQAVQVNPSMVAANEFQNIMNAIARTTMKSTEPNSKIIVGPFHLKKMVSTFPDTQSKKISQVPSSFSNFSINNGVITPSSAQSLLSSSSLSTSTKYPSSEKKVDQPDLSEPLMPLNPPVSTNYPQAKNANDLSGFSGSCGESTTEMKKPASSLNLPSVNVSGSPSSPILKQTALSDSGSLCDNSLSEIADENDGGEETKEATLFQNNNDMSCPKISSVVSLVNNPDVFVDSDWALSSQSKKTDRKTTAIGEEHNYSQKNPMFSDHQNYYSNQNSIVEQHNYYSALKDCQDKEDTEEEINVVDDCKDINVDEFISLLCSESSDLNPEGKELASQQLHKSLTLEKKLNRKKRRRKSPLKVRPDLGELEACRPLTGIELKRKHKRRNQDYSAPSSCSDSSEINVESLPEDDPLPPLLPISQETLRNKLVDTSQKRKPKLTSRPVDSQAIFMPSYMLDSDGSNPTPVDSSQVITVGRDSHNLNERKRRFVLRKLFTDLHDSLWERTTSTPVKTTPAPERTPRAKVYILERAIKEINRLQLLEWHLINKKQRVFALNKRLRKYFFQISGTRVLPLCDPRTTTIFRLATPVPPAISEQVVATSEQVVATSEQAVTSVEQAVAAGEQAVATDEQVMATIEQVVATSEQAVMTVEQSASTIEQALATVEEVVVAADEQTIVTSEIVVATGDSICEAGPEMNSVSGTSDQSTSKDGV